MIPVAHLLSGPIATPSGAPLPQTTPPPAPPTAPGPLLTLAHGTPLTTRVTAQLPTGGYLLTVGGQPLAAHSQLPLTVGDKLVVRVDLNGPELRLRIIDRVAANSYRPASAAFNPTSSEAIINRALRQALPRQIPISSLAGNLNQLPLDKLDARVASPLQQVMNLASNPQGLQHPVRLRQALTGSGVLLENNLLIRPGQPPTEDVKASLLQLLQATMKSPTQGRADQQLQQQIRDITRSALARIETQQLATLRDDSGQRLLTTDLMLSDGERTSAVEIAIDRQHRRDKTPQDIIDTDDQTSTSGASARHRWQVTLNFDLPGIGRLQSLLRLDGAKLSIDFRTDQSTTRAQLSAGFEQLATRLTHAGIADARLTAGIGPAHAPSAPSSATLIDSYG